MISRDAKYVIFDNGLDDVPVIFPNHITHNTMAMMIGHWKPVRAGFVRVDAGTGTVEAYGNSTSLRLSSDREVDSQLIRQLLCK